MLNKAQFLIIGIFLGILVSAFLLLIFKNKPDSEYFLDKTPIALVNNSKKNNSNNSTESKLNANSETTKLNLNTCTLEELMSLPGIGESKALAIIDFRARYGDFNEISELLYVPGIGENLYNDIENYFFLEN